MSISCLTVVNSVDNAGTFIADGFILPWCLENKEIRNAISCMYATKHVMKISQLHLQVMSYICITSYNIMMFLLTCLAQFWLVLMRVIIFPSFSLSLPSSTIFFLSFHVSFILLWSWRYKTMISCKYKN